MCTASMILGDMHKWGQWPPSTIPPSYFPGKPDITPAYPPPLVDTAQNAPLYAAALRDSEIAKQLLDVIARLEALDKKVGLINCSVDTGIRDKYVALLEQVVAKGTTDA